MSKPATKVPKVKEPIKIRFKALADGSKSIYLEKYETYNRTEAGTITTKKNYEFLRLYIIPERTVADKTTNQTTLALANAIKAKKIVELQNNHHGFKNTASKIKTNLVEYIRLLADEALEKSGLKRSVYYTLHSLSNHIRQYAGEATTFAQVDKEFILGFVNYLKTAKNFNYKQSKKKVESDTLSQNTQHNLYVKFVYVLKRAVNSDIISFNPLDKIESDDKPKTEGSKREYLTIEEIKVLINTDCKNKMVKHAFLFCCLSGLRYSDVSNIVWGDLWKDNEHNTILRLKVRKTKRNEDFPISDEALRWLPENEINDKSRLIFRLPKNEHANTVLRKWIADAGIKKSISFHCSRHTAATLNLSLGVPVETVSKLLGHTKISTTQIYAKILDKAKKDALSKQNGIFD